MMMIIMIMEPPEHGSRESLKTMWRFLWSAPQKTAIDEHSSGVTRMKLWYITTVLRYSPSATHNTTQQNTRVPSNSGQAS